MPILTGPARPVHPSARLTALFYQKDLIQDDYKGMANYILEFTEKST